MTSISRVGVRIVLKNIDDVHVNVEIVPFADLQDGRRVEVGPDRLRARMAISAYPDLISVEPGEPPPERAAYRTTVAGVLRWVRFHDDYYKELAEELADRGFETEEAHLRQLDIVLKPDDRLVRGLS